MEGSWQITEPWDGWAGKDVAERMGSAAGPGPVWGQRGAAQPPQLQAVTKSMPPRSRLGAETPILVTLCAHGLSSAAGAEQRRLQHRNRAQLRPSVPLSVCLPAAMFPL